MGRLLILFALLAAGSVLDNSLAWTLIISVVCMLLVHEAMRMRRVRGSGDSEPAE